MTLGNIKKTMKWVLNTKTSQDFVRETDFKNLATWNDEARVLRMVVDNDELLERIAKETLEEYDGTGKTRV